MKQQLLLQPGHVFEVTEMRKVSTSTQNDREFSVFKNLLKYEVSFIFAIMNNESCIRLFADKQQINNCKRKITVAEHSFTHLSKVLALSGNEVRLKIIFLLEDQKELCPCDLSDILGMSVPAVSQHLRKLKDGSIVETRKDGQTIYYSLSQENLKVIGPLLKHLYKPSKKLETV